MKFQPKSPIVSVDWANGELRLSPRTNRPKQRQMFYLVTRANGSTQWLRKSDIHVAEPVAAPELALNTEKVMKGKVVISHPANVKLEAKPKRIAHMAVFIAADPEYVPITTKGMEKAFVERLFAEGLLERNPDDIASYRPTSGGKLWFKEHQAA